MLPVSRFLSFINQHKLCKPSDKILVSVSGGRDSVVLAQLFNAAGFEFGIAHCNFGLRGYESDEDERFTQQLAAQLNAPFYSVRFDTEGYAKQHKLSIQMAARELRYDWFEQIRSEFDYRFIAIAHHASDTTETILLNLVRGTGIAGLHGILPKRDRLIRPLLFLSRPEISEIVEAERIAYREDSSNESSKYARNKIRLEVIPKLKELNAKLDDTFEANCKRFSQIEEFLNIQVAAIKAQIFEKKENAIQIALPALKKLRPLQLILFELFKPYGFAENVLDDLVHAWNGQPGKQFESDSHLIVLDRDRLLLTQKVEHLSTEVLFTAQEASISFNTTHLNLKISEITDAKIQTGPDMAFFDESLLQFPLKLRLWKRGDYFYPFGMDGKKKLSDFFTGLKIPITEKQNIPILENGNGDILWVVGYRSDNRYKVTSQTKKVITFEKH